MADRSLPRVDDVVKGDQHGELAERETGTVKWWNIQKKIGFITADADPDIDIFSHRNYLFDTALRVNGCGLHGSDRVSFIRRTGPKGLFAYQVMLLQRNARLERNDARDAGELLRRDDRRRGSGALSPEPRYRRSEGYDERSRSSNSYRRRDEAAALPAAKRHSRWGSVSTAPRDTSLSSPAHLPPPPSGAFGAAGPPASSSASSASAAHLPARAHLIVLDVRDVRVMEGMLARAGLAREYELCALPFAPNTSLTPRRGAGWSAKGAAGASLVAEDIMLRSLELANIAFPPAPSATGRHSSDLVALQGAGAGVASATLVAAAMASRTASRGSKRRGASRCDGDACATLCRSATIFVPQRVAHRRRELDEEEEIAARVLHACVAAALTAQVNGEERGTPKSGASAAASKEARSISVRLVTSKAEDAAAIFQSPPLRADVEALRKAANSPGR
jgi:cold shock CspA family protein